ncbi:NAD-dependent epimerase/dehydratase family protein [Amphiplicatus metriothermophilus]|uniref:Nucleoside-diphosphate-sugar epimerase n=1 Tax=Amphiplicatus metriothermophilus TaxID=1519374 RepID=A0A239PJG8_9PROT|nr:NAD(P)-dependent oxidoreductase [Amphiplicatus metriothermophilus]MBB5517738.1 nucleoside-diphosphate-sugar epimerase [Amphiplicatus metriothermophilus]SNT67928.1 Nucleoside-diphosphate-sugar epimerase [Amphiplicatus metriothermophilus]
MSGTIAVTGGSGFIGAALIRRLVARGERVKALARDPRKLPCADDIEPIAGALEDDAALARLAAGADRFIHCAGATHARRDADYDAVNAEGARRAAEAAARAGARFAHVSSLSARTPAVSPYAASKARGEALVSAAAGENERLIVRLPAVYGPGDRAALPYFRLVRAGIAPEPWTTPEARASLLFVEDAAEALVAALERAPAGAVYEADDDAPEGRAWREIGQTLGEILGRAPRRVRLPRPLVSLYHGLARGAAAAAGRPSAFRSGQVGEFFHPDWVARENRLSAATDWRPAVSLKEGFAKTVRWYQENGLL